MTADRDRKDLVRARAAKTGESYQAAHRQLVGEASPSFRARIDSVFRTPDGLAFGCVVESGTVTRGMHVTVVGTGVSHPATVTSLRRWKRDVDAVSADDSAHGQFGMIVDPPWDGPLPAHVTS